MLGEGKEVDMIRLEFQALLTEKGRKAKVLEEKQGC